MLTKVSPLARATVHAAQLNSIATWYGATDTHLHANEQKAQLILIKLEKKTN